MKIEEKILIALGLVTLAAFTVGIAAFLYLGRDIPAFDDSHLALEHIEVPPEENAFTYFESAADALFWPTNMFSAFDYFQKQSVDEEAVDSFIHRNRETLQSIRKGTTLRYCIIPDGIISEPCSSYVCDGLRLSKMMLIKSRHDQLDGRYTDAVDTCIDQLRFSNLFQRHSKSSFQYLVGLAGLTLGLVQARDMANDPNMPKKELERLLAELMILEPTTPGFIRALKTEYLHIIDLTEQLNSGHTGLDKVIGISKLEERVWWNVGLYPGYLFQPNKTKKLFADYFSRIIADAPLLYANMEKVKDDVFRGTRDTCWLLLRPNVFGNIVYCIYIPSLSVLVEKESES